MKIDSSCHCGAVKIEITAEVPSSLTECNCSICRRYGALFAYYPDDKVKIVAPEGTTDEYIWNNKDLAFVRCRNCGCFSHWRSVVLGKIATIGVNARLFTNLDIKGIHVRHYDGADTCKYLD